jgi:hypothetical protein
LDTAAGELILRVAGSSRDGQIVRLKSAKCTIGSGPRCTLRLRMPGVAPLHCLILRGRTGSVVRRLGVDTRLNHQSFTDAVLSPGDRLGIGPIELEVVSVGVETTATAPEASRCEEDESWRTEQADARRRLKEARDALDVERSDLEAQQRTLSEERGQWERQRNEHAVQTASRSEQLVAQTAEMEAERQSLDKRRQQWQVEQTEAQQRLDQDRDALAAERSLVAGERSELESQRTKLSEESREWEVQQAEVAARAEVQFRQLAVQTAGIETERQSLDQQRQQWQVEQAEAQRLLDQDRDAFAAAQAELEALRNALAEDRRQWEKEQAEAALAAEQRSEPLKAVAEAEPSEEAAAEKLQFEETPAEAPVNLADVFRRLGAKVELEEGESEPDGGAETVERPVDVASQDSIARATASAGDHDEEESVDQYMARLMQRIRSAEDDFESKSPGVSQTEPSRGSREGPVAGRPVAPPKAQLTPQSEPVAISRRAAAPEKKIDLSALRELANFSAQAAINVHSRRVLIRTMGSKLLVAIVALLASTALLSMWKLAGAREIAFYSGLLALLIAIYWGVQYALLTGRLIISKSGAIDLNPSRFGMSSSPSAEDGKKAISENAGQPAADQTEAAASAPTTSDSEAIDSRKSDLAE